MAEALLRGLAPDGGLYVPTRIPALTPDVWQSATSFQDLACRVLTPWMADEVPETDLAAIVAGGVGFSRSP